MIITGNAIFLEVDECTPTVIKPRPPMVKPGGPPTAVEPPVLGEWFLECKLQNPSALFVERLSTFWFQGVELRAHFTYEGRRVKGDGWLTSVSFTGPRRIPNAIDIGVDIEFIFQGTRELRG